MERPGLIDELAFCRMYGSFWRAITPTSEAFVRRVNLGLYERLFRPLETKASAVKRAFINELGFCLFREMAAGVWRGPGWVRPSRESVLDGAISEAWERLGRLSERVGADHGQVDPDEIREAFRLASRLQAYFREFLELVVEPRFPGCGIVEECSGDVMADSILVEIKAGDRQFRSIDLRQVITYLALNHVSPSPWSVAEVCFLNPRLGIEFRTPVQELCFGVSGIEANQLLDSIVHEMSRADMSR